MENNTKSITDLIEDTSEKQPNQDSTKVEDKQENQTSVPDDEKTGIQMFFEERGINSNSIPVGDETKSFDSLESNVQKKILDSLIDKPDFDEQAISDINILKDSNMNLEEFVNNQIGIKINEYKKSEKESDVSSLSDDDLYGKYIKANNPDITDDELKDKLDVLEESGKKESRIKAIKDFYKDERDLQIKEAELELEKKNKDIIENDRHFILGQIEDIERIGGWNLSKDVINQTLDPILETVKDKNGVMMSKFERDVMTDAKAMFKASWWLQNGEQKMEQLDQYAKKHGIDEYNRGRADAIKGIDTVENKQSLFTKKADEETKSKENSKIDKKRSINDLID